MNAAFKRIRPATLERQVLDRTGRLETLSVAKKLNLDLLFFGLVRIETPVLRKHVSGGEIFTVRSRRMGR